MSKIEKELLEATGIKTKAKEDRQAYLDRLIKAVQDLDDKDWEEISPKAQKWVNEGAKVVNDDSGDIPEFPDAEAAEEKTERTARKGRDADDDEKSKDDDDDKSDDKEDKPSRRGRAAKAKDDDDEKADKADKDDDDRGSRRRRAKGDDDDDKPARRSRAKDDDDDDKPTRKNGKAKDDDDDDDKPTRRAASKDKPVKKGGAQVAIKTAVIKNPDASTDDIAKALEKKGLDVTPSAVSTIRSGTLQTLRLVKELGMPKGDF